MTAGAGYRPNNNLDPYGGGNKVLMDIDGGAGNDDDRSQNHSNRNVSSQGA